MKESETFQNRQLLCRTATIVLRLARERARTQKLASALASFVPSFEINLVLLWPQCPEEQT